jgi:hypothetical protein
MQATSQSKAIPERYPLVAEIQGLFKLTKVEGKKQEGFGEGWPCLPGLSIS